LALGSQSPNAQQGAHCSTAPLVLYHTRNDKGAMKKFGINGKLRNKLFLIAIHRFSLVKAAMTPLRFVNCAMVLRKRLNFLIQMRNEYSPQPSKLLYDCQLKTRRHSKT
jgi:hypothetical protein